MKKLNLLYAIFGFLISFTGWSQLQFNEVAAIVGCENITFGTGSLGGGVSFFDFDKDGWDDLTFSSETGQPIRFFKNTNGFFTEVELGIHNTFEHKTVQWVDFDNDGDYDFFVTAHLEHNQLYENDGAMNFTDITLEAGLYIEGHLSYGSSWGDYNNDGLLDLFVSSHLDMGSGLYNLLYKNNGDGTFTDVSIEAGILNETFTSFCAAFFDYDKDGWQDIYVANDRDPINNLYHNNGDGTFADVSLPSGTGISIDAMSTTIDDANNDGWLDIYVTNTGAGNAFFINNQDGTFTDVAATNGTLMESVAWGAVFMDGENDGIKDLYVSAMIADPAVGLTSAYYHNDGSDMYTILSDIGLYDDHAISFGNAIGDINNDGLPDLTVVNYAPEEIFLYENETTTANNWLKVGLEGVVSNKMGIGSWIEISVGGEKQVNYTLCGEGYLGQNSGYEFFGIGPATEIDYVKVIWLSGIEDVILNPAINTHLTIVEGQTLGVEDQNQAAFFTMYPNPSEGVVTFQTSEVCIGSRVKVTDLMGRSLMTSEIKSKETQLDIRTFSQGVYLVTLERHNSRLSKRLVVE